MPKRRSPALDTPPLEGTARTGVIVIGAGFTGLSSALHLAERGVEVTVLESNEVGWGASGRNGGQVNPGLKFDPGQIQTDFGTDLGRRMIDFSGAAPKTVFDLIERHQIQCEARQGGTIRAAKTRRYADSIRASAENWERHGAPTVFLDQAGWRRRPAPGAICAACSIRAGGNVNPLGYARGLARAAQQAGVHIHGGSPALRIERGGRGVVRDHADWQRHRRLGGAVHERLYRRGLAGAEA